MRRLKGTGKPLNDRGSRLVLGVGNPPCWGLMVWGIGFTADRAGWLLVFHEHHLGYERGDGLYRYWGDLDPGQ